MNKKIAILALALCMVAAIAITGTIAYFYDEDEATNVFTVGKVEIDLTEDEWDKTGKEEAKDSYPGEALAKDPVVTNKGNNPCFVRIKVTGLDQFTTATKANGEVYGADGLIKVRTNGVIDALGEGWVKYGDYYYYEKVLPAGESTTELFDHIVIPVALENDGTDAEYDIDVYAEAVQAQGAMPSFSAVEQMKAPAIADWFGTAFTDAE